MEEKKDRVGKVMVSAYKEMVSDSVDGWPNQWSVRTAVGSKGVSVLKEYHAGPLAGKTFCCETGVEVTEDKKIQPFVPAQLRGSVTSNHLPALVISGGTCPYCERTPCFSMGVQHELYEMERDLVKKGKSHGSIRDALLERGYRRFCASSPSGKKPEKLPLCFGMY